MNKILKYISLFFVAAILLMIALSINNMFWRTTSPEWEGTSCVVLKSFGVYPKLGVDEYGERVPLSWCGPIKDKSNLEIWGYLLGYRVLTVWTNMRDIGSAILVGLLFVLITMVKDKLKIQEFKREWS